MTCITCSGDGCVLCEGSGVLAEFDTFPSLLERLHKANHTGAVVLHLLHGHPRSVEFVRKPALVRLDKPA